MIGIFNRGKNMDTFRDFSELTMMSKKKWKDEELDYYQQALSQVLPYINSEGLSKLHEINEEMYSRSLNK
jgi:hypothetical protein